VHSDQNAGQNPGRPVVALKGVGKSFGPTTVLRDVDLDLAAGEIVALLGANGAGKSTLITVLAGGHPDHAGSGTVDGTLVPLESPAAARRLGIRTVHQRIGQGLVPTWTVAENLLLDELAAPGAAPVVNRRAQLAAAREVAATLGLDWPDRVLRSDVADLALSDQQLVVLARALSPRSTRPRLLVLDEPTSALSAPEADRLLSVVARLRDEGLAILYVSHRLGEVDGLADRAVVLRNGSLVAASRRPLRWPELLEGMLGGRATLQQQLDDPLTGEATVLRLRGVRLLPTSAPIDLDVRGGEVTGVVGLLGAGKSELAQGVFGGEPFAEGRLELAGRAFAPRHPRDAVRAGVHLVPEDRAGQALLPGWSLASTVTLPVLDLVGRAGLVHRRREDELAQGVVDDLGIVTPAVRAEVEALSGGNQQKAVVGRWLTRRPELLLLDEPFRGVDIGARRDIGRRVRRLAGEGAGVVVLSSDVDEVLEVADRIVVLVEGTVRLDVRAEAGNRRTVVDAMSEVA
jgi:simple sugar transport system ATP-binding protein